MVYDDGLFGEVFWFHEQDEFGDCVEFFLGDLGEAFGAEGVVAVYVERFLVLQGTVYCALQCHGGFACFGFAVDEGDGFRLDSAL